LIGREQRASLVELMEVAGRLFTSVSEQANGGHDTPEGPSQRIHPSFPGRTQKRRAGATVSTAFRPKSSYSRSDLAEKSGFNE
jgi:hypothetical protein